jgi:glucose dehydrogenase
MRRWLVGAVLAAVAAIAGSAWLEAQGSPYAGADWRAPGGDWGATRYSTLTQISTRTVKNLGGAWMAALPERADATPLVHGGRLFVVTNNGQILAFNPGTGGPLWTFKPEAGFGGRRGVGIGGGLLFAGLRDSNVIAISETTGQVVWTYRHGPEIPSQGMSSAPA